MKVLLIRKPTNLEQHGESVERHVGLKSEHHNLLERSHQEHYECLYEVRRQLENAGLPYSEIERSTRKPVSKFDAVVTVGGDGTLLTASHRVETTDLPILGIRSSAASVGYLCAGDIRHVADLVKRLAADQLSFKARARIRARVRSAVDGAVIETFPILNDFLYTNANPASTTRYQLGKYFIRY